MRNWHLVQVNRSGPMRKWQPFSPAGWLQESGHETSEMS